MKKSVIFILCLLPFMAISQSFPELIKMYEQECNQMVTDTVIQQGSVHCALLPVRDEKEEVIGYHTSTNCDTIWADAQEKEYKNPKSSIIFYGSGRVVSSNFSNSIMIGTDGSATKVERPHIYKVKLREVEPFSEHFWEWLKERK